MSLTWIILLTVLVTLALVLGFTLLFRDGRRTLYKIWSLISTFVITDIGIGGFVRLIIYNLTVAIAVAFSRGRGERGFNWTIFVEVLVIVTVVNIIANIINSSLMGKDILSPRSGHIWRYDRKAKTAALLKRINLNLSNKTATVEETKILLTDLLDVIVSHIRDHRGSHNEKKHDVFANLMLESGDSLVVVARDSMLHKTQYQRHTPISYPKNSLLAGRALQSLKPLSAGEIRIVYPEGPQDKPYRSVLVVPLLGSDDKPYGVLSVDSSRPYFFETFNSDQLENQLENSLQPYTQLITIVLEQLISNHKPTLIEKLAPEINKGTSLPEGRT